MNKIDEREAVLYAFAVEASHGRETLDRYLKQYPELAEDLIDICSEFRCSEAPGGSDLPCDDLGWEDAWQAFRGCTPAAVGHEVAGVCNVFPKGVEFGRLADTLSVPRSLLAALRDGLVAAESIPERFVNRIAEATGISVASIRAYFVNPRSSLGARAFKAAEGPAHQGQKTFRELVESTQLSDDQRRRLLQDLNENGLD